MGVIEALPAELGVQRHRLTVEQYHRMAEAGALARDARVELIEGVIVGRAPIGSRHAATVKKLDALLTKAVGAWAIVSVRDPIRLGDRSEPQPDLALLRPREDFYAGAPPTAADTLLIVEVSQATGAYDRQSRCRCTRSTACRRCGSSTSTFRSCAFIAHRTATDISTSPRPKRPVRRRCRRFRA